MGSGDQTPPVANLDGIEQPTEDVEETETNIGENVVAVDGPTVLHGRPQRERRRPAYLARYV